MPWINEQVSVNGMASEGSGIFILVAFDRIAEKVLITSQEFGSEYAASFTFGVANL